MSVRKRKKITSLNTQAKKHAYDASLDGKDLLCDY